GKIQDLYYNPSMYSASVTAIANYWNSQDRADLAIDVLTRFVTHKTILPGECLRLLASLYRQQQNWTCAVRIWQQLAEKRCAQSLENLAKYYEHREKNYQQALTYARLMLPLVCDTTEVDYRIARLQGKLSRLCVVTKKHKMHVSSLNQGETSPCMLPLSMSS
ncbi:MAG: hypothetical protein OEZ58_23295, partial [Gammaproteobacteria bacterium]|nr:hypothetical protein [Gammaproteobacteria bacterium]